MIEFGHVVERLVQIPEFLKHSAFAFRDPAIVPGHDPSGTAVPGAPICHIHQLPHFHDRELDSVSVGS